MQSAFPPLQIIMVGHVVFLDQWSVAEKCGNILQQYRSLCMQVRCLGHSQTDHSDNADHFGQNKNDQTHHLTHQQFIFQIIICIGGSAQ